MTREDLKFFFTFMLDWVVVAGGIITGGMLESGIAQLPKTPVVILGILVGFTQAALKAKALLEGRPPENIKDTVSQLVTQMKNVQTVQAVTTPSEIKEVLRAPAIKDSNIILTRTPGTDV